MAVGTSKTFTMAGTQKTFQYIVLLTTRRGRLGVRQLSESLFRVRVEPRRLFGLFYAKVIFKALTRAGEWKQPGDDNQQRFSKVVTRGELGSAILKAAVALGFSEEKNITFNASVPVEEALRALNAGEDMGMTSIFPLQKAWEDEEEEEDESGGLMDIDPPFPQL